MIYELFGKIHKTIKKLLKKEASPSYRLVDYDESFRDAKGTIINECIVGDEVLKKSFYPIENVISKNDSVKSNDSFRNIVNHKVRKGVASDVAIDVWMEFIRKQIIPVGFRNEGLTYAGYILEYDKSCLPSWIWTNAALVRMYCSVGDIGKAKDIGDRLLALQLGYGGWIVRNDYSDKGCIPTLAPNDSAYIANNSMLELYKRSGNSVYLESAKKCAGWIMETARDDGMVYVGYNCAENKWIKNNNIVDVGFLGGFMAELYKITKEEKYREFLIRFINRYIALFYDNEKNGFATGLDSNDRRIGGMFGRGQAWALEGLIPAYEVLKDDKIKQVIIFTIDNILSQQNKKGGWAYNLTRKYYGIDCKAVSVIAMSLVRWLPYSDKQEKIKASIKKAMNWCLENTSVEGDSTGGIFSYCLEGAIVHHKYTNTAFTYTNAYAIELFNYIKKDG